MFGDLIGYGDYGFVYEDETETNGPDGSVVKIMPMSNVCNQQQYNLFKQLENQQNQGIRTPGLPFVFATFRGQMNANVLNVLSYATSDAQAKSKIRREFPLNSEYGIVIMERLPCVAANQFCGRNLRDTNNQLEEQSVYESMVTYLYDTGWWVRDLIDPRNVGYNIHGEPVWFDPMVARRQGFPGFSQAALEQCHEEVVAYPVSYRKAVESGEYFTQRHGYGLFHSEAQTSTDLLHQAKNWPLIRDYQYGNSPNFVPSLSGNTPRPKMPVYYRPNDIKILNSWEEWENMDREDQFGKWYYINWPCTVYRGSLKRGIDYETYLEDTAIKPGGHSANMGYQNVIAAAPELSEALMFGAFNVNDEGDIFGYEASELYAFDIQNYVVTFPRLSTRGRSGRDLPVIFIAGGVYHDDAILLWEKEATPSDEYFRSENMNAYLYNHRLGWKVEGDINSLNERRPSFPNAINYASHNYTPKGFFGLGDLFGADSYISQDYPQCYLCGLPAKQEVLTAVGMRNFCSNKCRGEYEGIDYGPDDYYVSPPLEHKLEVVSYDRGDADYDYRRDAKATISCRNCSFSEDLSFYQPHQKLRGDWHLQRDEDGDQIPKQFVEDCDHEMEVVKYIYSDWEYPGVITVRCRKCKLADEIRVANLPEGCDNRGKPVTPIYFGAENYNLQALLDILTDRDWDDIEWSDNEPRPRTIGPDDWGEDVEWNNKYISTTGIFYSPAGRIGLQLRSAQVMSPNTWSGISGFLDAGETPYEAVVREIHEESGLPMEVIKTWRYRVIWDNGLHRTYLFYVDTEFEPEVNEFKWEWDDWRWDTMDAWKRVPNLHPGMMAALQEASE